MSKTLEVSRTATGLPGRAAADGLVACRPLRLPSKTNATAPRACPVPRHVRAGGLRTRPVDEAAAYRRAPCDRATTWFGRAWCRT